MPVMTKQEAIEKAGSASKLSRLLRVSRAAVSNWQTLPELRVYQLKEMHPEWFKRKRN